MKNLLLCSVGMLLTAAFVLLPEHALAAVDADFVSKIVHEFHQKTSAWEGVLRKYALIVFQWLLILEICWLGFKSVLGNSSIQETLKQFVFLLLMAGFFLAVINNYATWAWNIIHGLQNVGKDLVPGAINSDSPFIAGIKIVELILSKLSAWSPGNSIALLIAALVVIVCFALISAQVVFIKCEAMIAIMAAFILVGFGSSSFLKDYAVNALRYVLSVAFKLFVMQLVLGVGINFINSFETSTAELQDIFIIIGASVVLFALVKSLPDVVAGIINGSHVSSGMAFTGALAAAGGAALGGAIGASAATSRSVQNVRDAANIANFEGKSGIGKATSVAGTLMHARQAAKHDVNATGNVGQRARSHIQDRLELAREERRLSKKEGNNR